MMSYDRNFITMLILVSLKTLLGCTQALGNTIMAAALLIKDDSKTSMKIIESVETLIEKLDRSLDELTEV